MSAALGGDAGSGGILWLRKHAWKDRLDPYNLYTALSHGTLHRE